jgi:thiol-disulfide isomerase/thioredoxin
MCIKTFSIFATSKISNFYTPELLILLKKTMRNTLILAFFLLTFTSLKAQDDNLKVFDEKSEKDILLGSVTREGLISMGGWFNEEYNAYQPNQEIINNIKLQSNKYPYIFIILGTWCGDSREQVPHFLKIMDQLSFPPEQIYMVAVDRNKRAGNFCIGDFNVTLVPTFIFTADGEETGRIVETPVTSLEQDFLNILNGKEVAPDNK